MRNLAVSILILGSLLAGCIGYGYPGRGGGHYYYHHHDWR
jgi:hypothetical protein